jgi:hypothetical protein
VERHDQRRERIVDHHLQTHEVCISRIDPNSSTGGEGERGAVAASPSGSEVDVKAQSQNRIGEELHLGEGGEDIIVGSSAGDFTWVGRYQT